MSKRVGHRASYSQSQKMKIIRMLRTVQTNYGGTESTRSTLYEGIPQRLHTLPDWQPQGQQFSTYTPDRVYKRMTKTVLGQTL